MNPAPNKMTFWERLKLPVNTFPLRHEIIKANMALGPGDAVADIGVGTGYSAFNFAPEVREIAGIDVAAPVIEFLESLPRAGNAKFYQADVCDPDHKVLKRLAGKFDRVYAADVLEHVPTPSAFFRTVASLLNKNGSVLVTFPNTVDHGITHFQTKTELNRQILAAGLRPSRFEIIDPTTWLRIIYAVFVKLPLTVHRRLRRRPGEVRQGDEQTFDETYAFAFNRRQPRYRVVINFYFETLMIIAKIFPLLKATPAPEDILGRRVLIVATKENKAAGDVAPAGERER